MKHFLKTLYFITVATIFVVLVVYLSMIITPKYNLRCTESSKEGVYLCIKN